MAGAFAVWHTFFKPPSIRNVLLISIDTCRSDHLSSYGYPAKTTPNIDAVAAEGTLFRNVYSPIPVTLPAHCSILTGMNPPRHGVHDNNEYGFTDGSQATLAQLLRARGLTTAGIVSAFVLNNRYGLNQGFSFYMDGMSPNPRDPMYSERNGGETTSLALDFLQRNGSLPFFLFLHYYDPHTPYEPPEPFASQFRADPYAGEIAFVDACIGQVIAKLKNLGLYDSTLLVITGDHGEMLGEHGERKHSFFVYQSALKVPLIVRLPGQKQGRVVEEPVGLIDLVPTICGLLHIKPPSPMQGVDLAACVKGKTGAPAGRSFYCESLMATKYGGNSLLGLVQENWKYIQTTRPELYDLEKDPGEKSNLLTQKPEIASRLQQSLKSMIEKDVRAPRKSKTPEWDPKAAAALAALGYAKGSVKQDFAFDQDKPDPKDLIAFHEGCDRVKWLIENKRLAEAGSLCRELLSQNQKYADLYNDLGQVEFTQGNYAGVVEALTKAVELEPTDWMCQKNLALALSKLNRMDESLAHFQEAEKLQPQNPQVLAEYAVALSKANQMDEADRKFRKALQLAEEARDPEQIRIVKMLMEPRLRPQASPAGPNGPRRN